MFYKTTLILKNGYMRQHLFLHTIKYDKSLRICETLIGNYLESEGNAKFYLFAL